MAFLEELTRNLVTGRTDDRNDEAARLRLFDAALSWSSIRPREEERAITSVSALFGGANDKTFSPAARLLDLAARGRSSEVDDIHLETCTTPGTGICAVVLALAPFAPDVTAQRVLRSICAGYEAMVRSARQLGGPALLTKGIWPTRAVAPIMGAITASTMFDLDVDQSIEAVALAAGWLCEGDLSEPSRELSYAQSILVGVAAALSVRTGARGDRSSLDRWETRAVARPSEWHGTATSPPAAIVETTIKPFCGARQTLAATTAILDLVDNYHVRASDIVRIGIAVPPLHVNMINRVDIETRLHAISSMQYQVALALLRPDDLFDIERVPIADEEFRALMHKVNVRGEPELLEQFPERWGAIVEIETSDNTFTRRVEAARNESLLTWSILRAKGEKLLERAGVNASRLDELESITKTFSDVAGLELLVSLLSSPRRA